jgi:hypothetical protein
MYHLHLPARRLRQTDLLEGIDVGHSMLVRACPSASRLGGVQEGREDRGGRIEGGDFGR